MAIGKGTAKGIDFKVSKEFGKLSGHVSYSLLWADRQYPDKNHGKKFPARFDNRHKINVMANWKINDKWDMNVSWTGMSGNRITLPTQCWVDPGLGPWHYDMTLATKSIIIVCHSIIEWILVSPAIQNVGTGTSVSIMPTAT